MSDPTRPAPDSPSRGPLRALVLDPALLFARALTDASLAAAIDRQCGRSTATVFTPAVTTATFLSRVTSDDHSCRGAVDRLLAWRVANGMPACSPDTGGYCKARQRLPEALLPGLVRGTADRIRGQAPDAWLFHGRRVIIADGTTVTMPDTAENQAAYPQHTAQKPGCGFPIAQMVVLLCLATGVVLDAAIGRRIGKQTGEHALLRRLHGRLRPGDVLLADSYYSSFDEVMTLRRMGVDVVMRQTGGRRSDFRRGTRLGREDHLVEWSRSRNRRPWMSREEFAAMPRVMRMRELRVRVGRPGFRVRVFVVVTSLTDARAFPSAELAALYRRRWHAELDIRSIKQAMRMDVLRCRTPGMVRKEVWAHFLAYNLVRGVMAEAARRHGVEPRRLSFQGARQVLEAFRVELGHADVRASGRLMAAAWRAIAYHRVGARPDRVEPRVVKRRPKAYPRMQVPRRLARKRLMRAG